MATKLVNKSIGRIPKTTDRETLQFFSQIRDILNSLNDKLVVSDEGIVATRDSNASKDAQSSSGSAASADLLVEADVDNREPGLVTNFAAFGTFESIVLSWDYTSDVDVDQYQIHRAPSDDIGLAYQVGVAFFPLYSDPVGFEADYYYWVRAVSTGGTLGQFQSIQGLHGTTTSDPLQDILDVSGDIQSTDLASDVLSAAGPDLSDTWAVAVEGPNNRVAGIGLIASEDQPTTFAVVAERFAVVNDANDATETVPFVVQNGQTYINTAVIADASIDSAKIRNLAADKIVATELSAITSNIGTLTSGRIQDTVGRFILDLDNEKIEVRDVSGNLRVRLGKLS